MASVSDFDPALLTWETPDFGWAELSSRKIIWVELNSPARQSIDAWMRVSEDIRRRWDAALPLLIMIDASKGTFFPSSYTQQRLLTLMKVRPELKTHSSLILANNFTSHLIQTMLRVAQRDPKNIGTQVFFTLEAGVVALEKIAQQHTTSQVKS
ncbi:MAG: hypothetical protein H7Y11_06205 [Armatimonadetes bacterium]|nr:hypothetical protein [Anaerolineae bacterium]